MQPDPIAELPVIVQGLIAVATVVLMLVVGRYTLLALEGTQWLWRWWRASRGFEDRDDSRRSIAIPPKFSGTARLIYDLGYTILGSLSRTYPRAGLTLIFHLFRTVDDSTIARFHESPPHPVRISLVTWFQDDSVIVTEYPYGQHLENERIVSSFLRGSLAAAQTYHSRRVAEWISQGRVVKPIGEMADYIRQEAYFHTHYAKLFGSAPRNRMAILLIPALIAIAAAIALLIATYRAQEGWMVGLTAVLVLAMEARTRLFVRFTRITYQPPGAADDGQSPEPAR